MGAFFNEGVSEGAGAILAVALYVSFHLHCNKKTPDTSFEGHPQLVPAMTVLISTYSALLSLHYAVETGIAKMGIANIPQPKLQPELQMIGILAGIWLAAEIVLGAFGIGRPGSFVAQRKRPDDGKKTD